VKGIGQFKPIKGANPFLGQLDELDDLKSGV
jgi:hypothetical protein